jgi:hypothetical protein
MSLKTVASESAEAHKVDRLLRKMPVRLGPMAKEIAEGVNIRRQKASSLPTS